MSPGKIWGSLLDQVAAYGLPLVVEPAGPEAVIFDGIDLLYVPSVLNTTDVRWIVGKHREWVSIRISTGKRSSPKPISC